MPTGGRTDVVEADHESSKSAAIEHVKSPSGGWAFATSLPSVAGQVQHLDATD
jgi:hypothetical protein